MTRVYYRAADGIQNEWFDYTLVIPIFLPFHLFTVGTCWSLHESAPVSHHFNELHTFLQVSAETIIPFNRLAYGEGLLKLMTLYLNTPRLVASNRQSSFGSIPLNDDQKADEGKDGKSAEGK